MKIDVMSVAAVALVIGVMLSSVGIEETVSHDVQPPTDLQQGIALR
jgi:hypothetical protein